MPKKLHIGFLSTYPPKKDGIATYTRDLTQALDATGLCRTSVIAVSGSLPGNHHGKIIHLINQDEQADYIHAARFVNNAGFDVLVIEHDFMTYGGDHGKYILELTDRVKIPTIVTLHSVPQHPDRIQRQIIQKMTAKSLKVFTFADNTNRLLESRYKLPIDKTETVLYGVPPIRPESREELKNRFGYSGMTVLTSFGLLNPGKGLEYSIEAMAKLVNQKSDIIYLILGQTLPGLSDISYIDKLAHLVSLLDLENHVQFVSRYLTQEEIGLYLKMSDICITPYVSRDRSVSGTLALAIGSGRIAVSTPYPYAQELLANGLGRFADFEDAASIARNVSLIINDPVEKAAVEKRVLISGKSMQWSKVAKRFLKLINEALMLNGSYQKAI